MTVKFDTTGFTGSDEERRKIMAALPSKAATPRKPRRLLVVTRNVHDGQVVNGHRSIGYANLAIEAMGRSLGVYETRFCNDPQVFRPEELAAFDAVCFNNTAGVLFEEPELRRSLLDFVSGGGGFVGIHAAAATFAQWPRYDIWPEFGEMLGAYEDGGHPWRPDEVITIKIDDPQSPINEAFEGKSFEVSDEVFQFRTPYSRQKLHVLMSIDTDKTDMSPHRRFLPERAADKDFAMAWIRSYGRGRVYYTSLGHNPHLFWDGRLLQHFLAGIQFALGDLDADTTPSARVPGQ